MATDRNSEDISSEICNNVRTNNTLQACQSRELYALETLVNIGLDKDNQ
jgi:hypothetical protein